MKWKKKKKHPFSESSIPPEKADSAEEKQKKREQLRLALAMLLFFCVLSLIYYFLIYKMVLWATPALYFTASVLFLAFYFVNRGFSREPIAEEILPADWSPERKRRFRENDIKRKKIGKILMAIMVPFLLLVGIDIIITILLPLLGIGTQNGTDAAGTDTSSLLHRQGISYWESILRI